MEQDKIREKLDVSIRHSKPFLDELYSRIEEKSFLGVLERILRNSKDIKHQYSFNFSKQIENSQILVLFDLLLKSHNLSNL